MRKIYISGKITGTTDYRKRFQAAEEQLKAAGYIVYNPAAINSMMPEETTYEEYMKIAFCMLGMADTIYLLDGWETSCGANREYGYALGTGKRIMCEKIRRREECRE